jgi:putative FmdB family regulatory protein
VGLRSCIYNGCIIPGYSGVREFTLAQIDVSLELIGVAMPIFEYRCEQCGNKFEAILFGEQKPECPNCHTHKLEQQLSTFSVSTRSSAPAASAGCGQANCCMMGGCSDN